MTEGEMNFKHTQPVELAHETWDSSATAAPSSNLRQDALNSQSVLGNAAVLKLRQATAQLDSRRARPCDLVMG